MTVDQHKAARQRAWRVAAWIERHRISICHPVEQEGRMDAMPTREEFLTSLIQLRCDTLAFLETSLAGGDRRQISSARSLVARVDRMIVRAGGQPLAAAYDD